LRHTVPAITLTSRAHREFKTDRRFSRSFRIGLPDQEARAQILKRTLRGVEMDESLDLNEWAERTKSFSGSDLKEFCRYAAQLPMRELVRSKGKCFQSFHHVRYYFAPRRLDSLIGSRD
jgi:SpoVK/Ycf46/Vps4 family AAA+-type ATPase